MAPPEGPSPPPQRGAAIVDQPADEPAALADGVGTTVSGPPKDAGDGDGLLAGSLSTPPADGTSAGSAAQSSNDTSDAAVPADQHAPAGAQLDAPRDQPDVSLPAARLEAVAAAAGAGTDTVEEEDDADEDDESEEEVCAP